MAAAVLEVGRFDASPIAHTFLYLSDYMVSLTTFTKPDASPNPLSEMKDGGIWGGTTCSKSKESD